MRPHTSSIPMLVFVFILTVHPGAAEELRFVLDPESSQATFDLDTTLHHVEGTLYLEAGEIRFDLDTGMASGEVLLDATRTDTGNRSRDKKMHKSVLESAVYPRIAFHPRQVSGVLGPDGEGILQLDGDVTIHGDTHPLTLEADVKIDGEQVTGESRFQIPYAEWGMKNPSLMLIRVAKEVEVELMAVGHLNAVGTVAEVVSQ